MPSMAFRSASTSPMGIQLNFSWMTFQLLGLMNAGAVGPTRTFLMPLVQVGQVHGVPGDRAVPGNAVLN